MPKELRDAPRTQLSFYDDKRGYYVPSDFATVTDIKRMKEEYTRLRDIERKRIKYLREKGLFSERYTDKMFANIPKISEMWANSAGSMMVFKVQLAKALSDVSKDINKGATTVKRATDRQEKLKADFARDTQRLKNQAYGQLDDIDFSSMDPEAFYDLMDYYKDIGDNFNYWTGRELKQLFGLDYESEIVEKTPQVYLDNLYSPKELKKEVKKEIRKTKRQIKKKVKKTVKKVKKKAKKTVKKVQKSYNNAKKNVKNNRKG